MATPSELDLEALEEEITDADAMVDSLCNGAKWTMCVPARPGQDSDLVIADGLAAGRKAIRELRAARQRIAELEGERRKVVPAYQDACGRLYLGTTHAQALEAAEALGAVIPDDSCGGWLMSDGTYLPQHPATPAAREGER